MKSYLFFLIIGASAYWVPDVLIHLAQPPQGIWIALLTLLVPFVVFCAGRYLSKSKEYAEFQIGIPLFMLIGIWFFGPLGLAIGAVFSGGTFFQKENVGTLFQLWAFFPVTTFIMSTYSGSLGGLVIATLMLIVRAAAASIKRYA